MRFCNTILSLYLAILLLTACQSERYRKDRKNRVTKHTEKASDYLAKQSIELTQENIDNRKGTDRKSRKRLEKQQRELNEANQRTSKVKSPKKHRGNFKFY